MPPLTARVSCYNLRCDSRLFAQNRATTRIVKLYTKAYERKGFVTAPFDTRTP